MNKISYLNSRIIKVLKQIKHFVFFDESRVVYNGKTYRSYWESLNVDARFSPFSRFIVKTEAKRAFLEGGFRPDEFFLYGLVHKNKEIRDKYLSQKMKDRYLISFYGSGWRDVFSILRDKYVFYTYLKDFFNRDVTYIKDEDDRLPFLSFCNQHHQVFAKLNKGNCGIGARSLLISDEEQANAVFDELVSSGEWIIEELIKQNALVSTFNSSSINTVRFPSFKRNGVVECVFPCMRFGRLGSIVDNAGQGGVFVSVDENSGEIISDAFDERGNVFVSHPDSGMPFRGFRVPQWEDLIESVKKAHLALPDNQVYVAFDFALSDQGWCIVEGNWGDWILQQTSLQRGFRNEFVSLLMGRE